MSIFGSIGHFLFGGPANSQTQSQTNSTATRTPYAPIVPALNDYIGKVGDVFNSTPQISPLEQSGYDAVQGVAGDQTSINGAIAQNDKTASGMYLTPDTNPYLADIAKRVGGSAMATINNTFGGAGRTGSGLHEYEAGKGVGDALTDLYGGVYQNERGLQEAAVGRAGSLDASRYVAPQALISAGQNVSARPFDIATQQGSIMAALAGLGGTTTGTTNSTGSSTGQAESSGLVGNAIKSFTNKLFQ